MIEQNNCHCGQENSYQSLVPLIQEMKTMDGALIPILHLIQEKFSYLPKDALELVATELNISMAEIYGVATFYSLFSLQPKGKYVIRVCLGTACYVKGAQEIIVQLNKELNINVNETTKDGMFTLEATRCLGACGLAPVMVIGDHVYGKLTVSEIPKILSKFREVEEHENTGGA